LSAEPFIVIGICDQMHRSPAVGTFILVKISGHRPINFNDANPRVEMRN
jgi:hypothetical protein